MAPEVLEKSRYTEAADIYSFGMILFELITETLPFAELNSFNIPGRFFFCVAIVLLLLLLLIIAH